MDLNGTWYNQLKSKMTLKVNGKTLTGTYHTEVGDAEGVYELIGQTDIDNDKSQAVGWVVVWNNEYGSSDSVTAWSGQYRTIDGEDIISTTWLLTDETSVDDEWASTLVGKNIFTRNPPTNEKVKESMKRGNKQSSPSKKRSK